jgi:fatty-acyl-CoA synthase
VVGVSYSGSDEFPALGAVFDAYTVGDLLVRAAHRDPQALALVLANREITYEELLDEATGIARGLLGLGIGQGDHVGVFMPNCPEFVAALFGVALIGAVLVPFHARYRAHELRYALAHSGVKLVLVANAGDASQVDHVDRMAEAVNDLNGRESTTRTVPVAVLGDGNLPGGFMSGQEFTRCGLSVEVEVVERARSRVRVGDPAMLLYTSGTTARPKACLHTHEALTHNGIMTGRTRFFLTRADRFWDPLPMYHVGFIIPLLGVVDAGSALLAMNHIESAVALRLIDKYHATCLYPAFPPIADLLLNIPPGSAYSLGSVRVILCVGAPSILRRLQATFPAAIQISTYGGTETGGVIAYHRPEHSAESRATTCGTPMRGIEIRAVAADTDNEIPNGEVGEIQVRGYSVLSQYYRDPEGSALAFTADGWFRSGDLGSLDDDGQVRYLGRLKDMLKVGGENVAALEVEEFLLEHPKIKVAQIVGAPDPRLEEVVVAYLEMTDGATLTHDEVVDYCRGKIASFKVPRYIRFVHEWPMSATKIRKETLRERIAAELSACDRDDLGSSD